MSHIADAVAKRLAAQDAKKAEKQIKDMLTMNGLELTYNTKIVKANKQIENEFPFSEEHKQHFIDLERKLISGKILADKKGMLLQYPCGKKGSEFETKKDKCLKIIGLVYQSEAILTLYKIRFALAKHLFNWIRCEAEKVKPTKTMMRQAKYVKTDRKSKKKTCKFPEHYNEKNLEFQMIPIPSYRKEEEKNKYAEIAGNGLEATTFNSLLDQEMINYCKCNMVDDYDIKLVPDNYQYPDDALKCMGTLPDADASPGDVEVNVRSTEAGGRRRRRRKSRKKRRKSRKKRRKSRKKSRRRRRISRRRHFWSPRR